MVAASATCAAVLGLAIWRVTGEDRGAFEVDVGTGVEAAAAEPSGATEGATSTVFVHVAGAVARPGLVELPGGSRVADAIAECGGVLGSAATEAVNLARVLVDGEQVLVPTHDEVAEGDSQRAGLPDAAGGKVDLNTASAGELEELPGIGPATAEKIVSDREVNGPFASPEDLQRVPGIGPKKFEALKDLVTVR